MAAGGMIVIGQSRAGKTTGIRIYEEGLQRRGFHTLWFDDKDYLMQETVRDMTESGFDLTRVTGRIETEKTSVLNSEVALTKPRTLQLLFKDGRLLNDAHRRIMEDISSALHNGDSRLVVLADLAYGNNVDFHNGREPLLQSGQQFIDWFEKYRILDGRSVIIREITAPFVERAARNELSEEKIEAEEFKLLFPDLAPDYRGFFESDRIRLGGILRHIHNSAIPEQDYQRVIWEDFELNFLPLIDGEAPEGRLPWRART